jgi:MFS family permease
LVAVALPLLTITLTRSPLVIAGVTAANKASVALAALPAGVVADRMDRRKVMLASNVVAGLLLSGLVAAMTFGRADLVMVYVVASVLAACDVTYTLAMQASFPDVVALPDQLATANGRLMSVEGAGEQFLGPGSGGVLFSLARKLPFLADGISFFVSAMLVRGISPPRGGGERAAGAAGPGNGEVARAGGGGEGRGRDVPRWTADFRQGLRVFRQEPALELLAGTVASVAFSQSMVFAILVVYGSRTLHLGSTGYGVFLALASLMGVAAAFSSGRLQRRFGGSRLIMGGAVLVTCSYLGLAVTHVAALAVFVFGLQEVGVAVANVGSVTTRQELIPRELYGRVGSVHRLVVSGSAPLGAVLGGAIASVSSVQVTMFAAGALEVVMLVCLAPPLVRRLAAAATR